MKVVGIDGALLNFGLAIGDYNPKTNKLTVNQIIHLNYNRPPKNKSWADAKQVSRISQELRRCCQGAKLVGAELPGGTQSAAAAWSLGIALGTIASLDYDIQWVTPYAIKNHTGNKIKREMIQWAYKRHPNLTWPIDSKGRIVNSAEHCADAIGVLYTVLQI